MMNAIRDWLILVISIAVIMYFAFAGVLYTHSCNHASVVTDTDAEYHDRYCGVPYDQ